LLPAEPNPAIFRKQLPSPKQWNADQERHEVMRHRIIDVIRGDDKKDEQQAYVPNDGRPAYPRGQQCRL
jgi:hypothetical protein